MSVINTNVKSLIAQNAMTINGRAMSKTMEQLSTGKRINSAADDAAGLAISSKMTSQIKGLNQAVRNANDGISMIQTAEGATVEVTNMLQRMRELAVQAANDTNSSDDRTSMQLEVAELQKEITRISNNTQWNNMKISGPASMSGQVLSAASVAGVTGVTGVTAASGVSAVASVASVASAAAVVGVTGVTVAGAPSAAKFQVGANADQVITVAFKDLQALSGATAALTAGLSTLTRANSAITTIDTALKSLNSYRADLGAKVNRLTYAADNLANISLNQSASRSRIEDTDYAQATTELAKTQIIQQAATAMLAQANQQPSSVLSLLQ
jgi:flagellin